MVHQAIHIPDIAHNLLSTMQLRLNDVLVNDVPRFLTDTVTDLTHSLVIPTDATDAPYVIPLSLRGITSTFPTRRPTTTEYETLPHITLTDPDLPWDPRHNICPTRGRAHELPVGNRGPHRSIATVPPTLLGFQHAFVRQRFAAWTRRPEYVLIRNLANVRDPLIRPFHCIPSFLGDRKAIGSPTLGTELGN
ncbi:hypothetical protein MHU86_2029 [Fragilaria crotonensis]|nr:hypothetical protein MHU86_2029 [Fragilaria crotonensis]